MRISQLLLLILASILFNLSSFAICQEPAQTSEEKDKLVLGMIVPLTGPLSFFGKDYVRAYELAVKERPELKDIFNVEWEDSAYDSKQSVTAFNKLVSVDKADVILSFGGPMLSALAPLAESRKVPFFATESAKSDCEGKAYCSLFRNEENEWGEATWRMLRKRNKKRIGIIKNQNQFMNTFVDSIIYTKNSDESVEVLLDVYPSTTDLRSEVLQLGARKYDALGIYLLPGSHHGFLVGARALGKTFDLFGVEEFLVKEHNKDFPDITNGARVIAPWAKESYRKRFEDAYGQSAGFFYTPAAYDFYNLLGDVLTGNKGARDKELMALMHFTGTRDGVSGRYSTKLSNKGVRSVSFPIAVYKVAPDKTITEDVFEF